MVFGPVTELAPHRAQSEIFENVKLGDWIDDTDAYHRSSFALAAGAGRHVQRDGQRM